MKKIVQLLLFHFIFLQYAFSQNVGIGNTSPLAKLDINGDIAVRSADLTITSTYNYSLDVNTIKQSNYKLKASLLLGNFIIAGITSGADGRIITLTNRTGSSLEIYNDDATAIAANRIQTGTGSTVAVYPNGNVTLQYDAEVPGWVIKSMHNNSLDYFGGGGGGTSYWDLSGANISNTNSGNVGIGTVNPNKKLDIKGNASVEGSTLANTGFTIAGGGFDIASNDVSGQQLLKFDGKRIQSISAASLIIQPKPDVLALNPFGGNVGIGLINPRCRLTILSNTVAANNNTEVLQVAGKNPMLIFSEFNGTDYGYIKGVTDNSITPQFPNGGLEIGTVPGTDLFLTANYSPVLTVSHNNNIGIGTTNPDPAYKLSVSGHIRGKEIVVESNWADYVFNEKYSLPALNEIEQFIKINKHLPGIPSAAEIQKDGLKLGEVQTKMMEKIEELTLYIIELSKEINTLKTK